MLVLVRMTTGENWNCIMHATMVSSDCVLVSGTGNAALDGRYFDPDSPELSAVDLKFQTDGCVPFGTTAIPILYFGIFMLLCAYVMINIVRPPFLHGCAQPGERQTGELAPQSITLHLT